MDDPGGILLPLFLVLCRHECSFSYGDIAIPDAGGERFQKLSDNATVQSYMSEYHHINLRTPIRNQCSCQWCARAYLEKTCLVFWKGQNKFRGEPVLFLRLKSYPIDSFLGLVEHLNTFFNGALPQNSMCPTRYSDHQYSTLSRLSDTKLAESLYDKSLLEEYNRTSRVGNEFFYPSILSIDLVH